MFLDNELVFASAWSPTAQGANYSTNVYDLAPLASSPFSNLGRELGAGESLWLTVLVTASVTSGGAATVDFRWVTDDNASMTSPATLGSSGAIAKATLVAGYEYKLALPRGPYERYVAVNAQIATADLTAGTFKVYISKSVQDNKAYAAGYKLDS